MNDNTATYCPEDDKIRLYIGRVPKDEYLLLRKAGYIATPKQDCDFVAVWTTHREDIALSYADIIEDEDQSPTDRAADRAERFAGYRDKRQGEALTLSDSYNSMPSVHGYQSQALAERKAKKHNLIGTKAVNQWDKAEYWVRRTEGVISNALHKSAAPVRMGRIKKLESELRKREKENDQFLATLKVWRNIATLSEEEATQKAINFSGFGGGYNFKHPRPETMGNKYYSENTTSLYSLLTCEAPITGLEAARMYLDKYDETSLNRGNRTINHLKLRIAYENQMLSTCERAGTIEMIPGGFVGSLQIQKVNKSNATGRIVSVTVLAPSLRDKTKLSNRVLQVERLSADVYRAPTEEELKAFELSKKARKVNTPKNPGLINPTLEDAERLQAVWNLANREQKEVKQMTQAHYALNSKGSYASFNTKEIQATGKKVSGHWSAVNFPAICKVRENYGAVIVITDKPQKQFPDELWIDPVPALKDEIKADLETLKSSVNKAWAEDRTEEEKAIFHKARLCGYCYSRSASQFGFSDLGIQELGL